MTDHLMVGVLSTAAALLAVTTLSAQTRIESSVIGGGGGYSVGANMRIDATIGQAIVGHVVDPDNGVSEGFWYASAPGRISAADVPTTGAGNEEPVVSVTPNPVSAPTEFQLRNLKPGAVSLALYDAVGHHIATMFDEERSGSTAAVPFDPGALPSGEYIALLVNGGSVRSIVVHIVK